MTKEKAKEAINVMQAYVDGKKIQIKSKNTCKWYDYAIGSSPQFIWDTFDYRIKPEPKVRPYKDREECWKDMQNHQPFGWVKSKDTGNYVLLTIIASNDVFEHLFRTFTYTDDSPFGIVEEE